MKIRYFFLLGIIVLLCLTQSSYAAPISREQAELSLETFLAVRFPDLRENDHDHLGAGLSSRLSIVKLSPWAVQDETIAFVAKLDPAGYVLLRADDRCPPIKVYSDQGEFSRLPTFFIEVLQEELEQELAFLSSRDNMGIYTDSVYLDRWHVLLDPARKVEAAALFAENGSRAGPLLDTTWNQNSPYNYYSPNASGGPGGRAYAGCVATAFAQVLRYHCQPLKVTSDYYYTDIMGNCNGTHYLSDSGLHNYEWGNMPSYISSGSPTEQIEAVGQLIHHCGITVNMDFEYDGSSAMSNDVVGALQDYFNYSCFGFAIRFFFTDSAWYNMVNTDINNNRPIHYSMQSSSGGHAVVCDGCRNSNEIHLNLGWGGSCDAWYNMNNVDAGGYDWNQHGAVFEIAPNVTAPQNDMCAAASPVSEGSTSFDNTGATNDGPSASCQSKFDCDIWYCYTPASSGLVTVSLCGSSFDTTLAIYDSCSTSSLTEIACDDDACGLQSEVTFSATSRNSYLIRIGGYDSGQGSGTMSITTSGSTLGDFDGDGTTDIAVYNWASGQWWIQGAASNPTSWGGHATDIPVPADYDGDGDTDFAVYRSSTGMWYIRGGLFTGWGGDPTDVPVPGDYNGDGSADIAVYRKSNGFWYIRGVSSFGWGGGAYALPVAGDYNGDGTTEAAVYQYGGGMAGYWWIRGAASNPYGWGGHSSDIPVCGDYSGDGTTQRAVYRSATGKWLIQGSTNVGWGGSANDVPVACDYNGDGTVDIAIYRTTTGIWYVKNQFQTGWGGGSKDYPCPTPDMNGNGEPYHVSFY